MSDRVIITPYNLAWPAWFAQIAAFVAPALSVPYAIEHVGSTAVPGLAAKPIIDVDIVIAGHVMPQVFAGLSTIGYGHRGDLGIPGREAFALIDTEMKRMLPPHHLYACPSDGAELRKHLLFRDYLRTHPEAVMKYAAVKTQLAEQYGADRDGYTQAKTPCIHEIMRKADAWTLEMGWETGASIWRSSIP